MADLVAFEVEGSGYYLVPLGALTRYEIATSTTGESMTPLGWGWALPIVRWNTFHSAQIDTSIRLAPGVIAQLAAHHFIPSPQPAGPNFGPDQQGSTHP